MSVFCSACANRMFTCDIGRCECGSHTSSGSLKYCAPCAIKLNKCQACATTLPGGIQQALQTLLDKDHLNTIRERIINDDIVDIDGNSV